MKKILLTLAISCSIASPGNIRAEISTGDALKVAGGIITAGGVYLTVKTKKSHPALKTLGGIVLMMTGVVLIAEADVVAAISENCKKVISDKVNQARIEDWLGWANKK
jgi:hypothetical protein